MGYDAETIEGVIDKAVRSQHGCEPAFYAVTGSRLYGFPGEEHSDVDVRGFHLADWRRYALLDRPDEQIIVNQDGVTAGFEDVAHVAW
jgi:predicted nucleotidyltransferase